MEEGPAESRRCPNHVWWRATQSGQTKAGVMVMISQETTRQTGRGSSAQRDRMPEAHRA